jgi:hypothetical protein
MPDGETMMPSTSLDTGDDLAELAEFLRFLSDWLAADHGRLAVSLRDFTGNRAYGLSQLRADLDKFVLLLGGDGPPAAARARS